MVQLVVVVDPVALGPGGPELVEHLPAGRLEVVGAAPGTAPTSGFASLLGSGFIASAVCSDMVLR